MLLTSFLAATRQYVEPRVAALAGGLNPRTSSLDESLPNYDIRLDKSAFDVRAAYLVAARMSLRKVASIREEFSRGEAKLRQSVPSVRIEYNDDARAPEVISTDVHRGRAFLTRPSTEARPDILRAFLTENSGLIGVDEDEVGVLTTVADYSNPDGNLSFVEFSQEINGIPVFRGEVKAAFTRDRELVRVVNNLASGINRNTVSAEFGSSTRAVELAATFANAPPHRMEPSEVTEKHVVFGSGDNATIAEKMYFPIEQGVAVAAWRVAIWGPVSSFYVIVDANAGTLLWHKNVTEDQTQPATYGVYANPNAMINVADSPFPFTPGPTTPTGAQGAGIARSSITRIGNEPPYQFNSLGWIADGQSVTDGNAIQAGLDRDGTDGIDPNSEASSATRNFSYSYSPFNPNTNTGDEPVPAPQTYPGSAYQQGTVTQLFYISNWFHDELYRLGFTEQAKNFQNDNFGRGGSSGDRVRAEGQDSNGFNNANFSTFADGIRPRMQMYLWAGPTPDIDGNLDADVVIHEYAHGLSNRLHGNASGLTMNMSRGLGEGWSDFYGHAMLSEATDPINGIYTTGGYDTYLGVFGYTNNYYYGIRRFPKAVMSFTGGNGRSHNPLTFADADQSQLDVSDGAFARGPYGSDNADAVHNLGEIWSSALWEVRARMINRLGWAVGNRKVLQLVTDGMKLAPLAPTFITERDAIIAAAQASSPPTVAAADVADIWAGFAVRGIGASASVQVNGTGLGDARVTQAFDLPNITQIKPIIFSDTAGNGNGFPDPGETLQVNIPLTNSTGLTANGVSLSIVGGGSADYGTMNGVETASRAVTFSVPANLPCGGVLNLTLNVTSSLGQVTFVRSFSLGSPLTTTSENFDSVSAPQFPNGWTATAYNGGVGFVTTAVGPDSAPNSAFAADPSTVGGGTDLISPTIAVTAPGATIEFRHRFDTEAAWDGGLLEISIGG
ncbi:MAG: M36 family metallopeptidase, partial [Blastocatellia bacterium]|nr:M36 family metallopeptidase [Blastocatellia bacterium]